MRSVLLFLAGLVLSSPQIRGAEGLNVLDLGEPKYPLTAVIKETESIYTPVLLKILADWPAAAISPKTDSEKPVTLEVYQTPKNIDFIGARVTMEVGAPLKAVASVMEDVGHYVDLLPGFVQVNLLGQDKNQFDLFWEKHIPVFFIKNVKYTIHYWVEKHPDRVVFRGQLKEAKGITSLDSLIILDATPGGTRYSEFAFFDGDFGMGTTFMPGKIWKESIQDIVFSALARKMKSEKPELPYAEIQSACKASVETYPVQALIDAKKPFPGMTFPIHE